MRSFCIKPHCVLSILILALSACATPPQKLAKAEAGCQKPAKVGQYLDYAVCVSGAQKPIWRRSYPKFADIFDLYDAHRISAASDFDDKKINAAQYDQQIKKAQEEASKAIDERKTEIVKETEENQKALGDVFTNILQGVSVAAKTRANADATALRASQSATPIIIQNNPPSTNNFPTCSTYCRLMIESGEVKGGDPCAVQCAR